MNTIQILICVYAVFVLQENSCSGRSKEDVIHAADDNFNTENDESCSTSPSVVQLKTGDSVYFETPDFGTTGYKPFQRCSWKFQTSSKNELGLECDKIHLSLFASMYVTDGDKTIRIGCFFCQERTFSHTFNSKTATVGLQNGFIFTNKGFSCRMQSTEICYCGDSTLNRIIGGTETTKNKYKWVVLVRSYSFGYGYHTMCGGSLISDRWVLTGARCIWVSVGYTLKVLLGAHNWQFPSSDTMLRTALEAIPFPDYDDNEKYNHDIALIRIHPIDFKLTLIIRPLCLPTGNSDYANSTATVAGWGRKSHYIDLVPEELMEVDMFVMSHAACKSTYNFFPDSVICAINVNKTVCGYDIGGALWTNTGSGHAVQIGITSFVSKITCDTTDPAGFTRVTSYMPWIMSKIADSAFCDPST